MGTIRALVAALLGVAAPMVGCGDDGGSGADLRVDLVTNYDPATTFDSVRVDVRTPTGAFLDSSVATIDASFRSGQAVADIADLPAGEANVLVRLERDAMEVDRREMLVSLRGETVVTVVITCTTSDCVSPVDAGATMCATDEDCDDRQFCSGVERCLEGRCTSSGSPCEGAIACDEDGDTCGRACSIDDDCSAGETCIDNRCVECMADAAEVCSGGSDEDCDGFVDCADFDCDGRPCLLPGGADGFCRAANCSDVDCAFEGRAASCADGLDNDCDGLIDCEDPACVDGGECP